MKKSVSVLLTISIAFIALALGYARGRIDGRNAALIQEFKDETYKNPTDLPTQVETNLNAEQSKLLEEMSLKVKTGNSVADIRRLKDSLKRWDELFINPAPADLKPVYAILKERVQDRLADLEHEAKSSESVEPKE